MANRKWWLWQLLKKSQFSSLLKCRTTSNYSLENVTPGTPSLSTSNNTSPTPSTCTEPTPSTSTLLTPSTSTVPTLSTSTVPTPSTSTAPNLLSFLEDDLDSDTEKRYSIFYACQTIWIYFLFVLFFFFWSWISDTTITAFQEGKTWEEASKWCWQSYTSTNRGEDEAMREEVLTK